MTLMQWKNCWNPIPLLLENTVCAGIWWEKKGQYHNRFFDEFSVEWEESIQGMRGAVCSHPLADFSKIRTYQFPELPRFDPEAERAAVAQRKADGIFTAAGLPHGHTFLRLTGLYICTPTATSVLWQRI